MTTITLPAPQYPMLTRLISDPLFPPEQGAKDEPITWTLSEGHPLIGGMKVVRMHIETAGIAVYSVSEDGRTGMRNLIPMDRTRLVEEAMPLPVFVDELAQAEADSGYDDGDDESGDDATDDDGGNAVTQTDAQPTSRQEAASPSTSEDVKPPAQPLSS